MGSDILLLIRPDTGCVRSMAFDCVFRVAIKAIHPLNINLFSYCSIDI